MISRKNNILLYLILLIITLTFTEAVFFLLANSTQWTGQFWISLFSIIIAEIITFGYMIFADITSASPDTPVPVRLSLISLISLYDLLVVLSVLIFWLYFNVSLNIYLIIHFTLMWMLIITSVMLIIFKNHVGLRKKEEMNFVQLAGNITHDLKMNLEIINKDGNYDYLINSVKSLQEKIKYSDPVSSPALLETENKIITSIKELNLMFSTPEVNEKSINMATDKILFIIGEIDKRNRLITILK